MRKAQPHGEALYLKWLKVGNKNMSQNIARAYKEFLKQEKKREAKMKNQKVASSTGLLSRRDPTASNNSGDQMDTIINIIKDIRNYGGSKNGK